MSSEAIKQMEMIDDIEQTADPGDHLLAVARAARAYIQELRVQLREQDQRIRYLEDCLRTAEADMRE